MGPGRALALGFMLASPAISLIGCFSGEDPPGVTVEEDCPAKPCVCADGRDGVCPQGAGACACDVSQCDCSACPAFAPAQPSFVACGGDPTGTWRGTRFVLGDFGLTECAEELDPLRASGAFTLTLAAPNALDIDFPPFTVSGRVVQSCLTERDSCRDAYVQYLAGDCFDEACGVCSCYMDFDPISGTGSWSTTGTRLSLGVTSPAYCVVDPASCRLVLDYCVRGDFLEFRDADGNGFELIRG